MLDKDSVTFQLLYHSETEIVWKNASWSCYKSIKMRLINGLREIYSKYAQLDEKENGNIYYIFVSYAMVEVFFQTFAPIFFLSYYLWIGEKFGKHFE